MTATAIDSAIEQLLEVMGAANATLRALQAERKVAVVEGAELETVQAAARELVVSESQVYKWLKNGTLQGERRGRVWRVNVESRQACRRRMRAGSKPARALAIASSR